MPMVHGDGHDEQRRREEQVRPRQQHALVREDGPHAGAAGPGAEALDAEQQRDVARERERPPRALDPAVTLALRQPGPVEERLVAKDDDHQQAEAVEAGEHAKVGTPAEPEEQEAGNEGPQVRPEQEGRGPYVDLARALVEEEHVVDDGHADDLRRRAEEALQRAHGREGGIVGREGGADGEGQREELRPEQHRKSAVALAQGHREQAAGTLHEDSRADGLGNCRDTHVPLWSLELKDSRPPGQRPVA